MADAAVTAGLRLDTELPGAIAAGSDELPSVRAEGERLKLELENAQLRAQLVALARPWWRKAAVVTALTAILAAVVPITTAVQAHYQKERELALAESKQTHDLALEESKQAHEIRTSYLDRLDKPGAKLRTLRFVLATTRDPALQAWAQAEVKVVQADLDEIAKQIQEVDGEIQALARTAASQPSPAISAQRSEHNNERASLLQKKQKLQEDLLIYRAAP